MISFLTFGLGDIATWKSVWVHCDLIFSSRVSGKIDWSNTVHINGPLNTQAPP